MEQLHAPGDVIQNRYSIIAPLGQGGTGTTYEAKDLTQDQSVAVKVMSLRQITDWKVLELFEREAKILATLDHASIPNYLDYFDIDTPEDRRFYLVRELVTGESLADKVEKGWHATEAEVKEIATQVLKILTYLHSLTPPVIHRDIKPQNIIEDETGKIWLVDFGSVQDLYRYTISRSGTFVGTVGYMPPEQFRGQVIPASDLYAFGATLLYLLTHRSPDSLPQRRMKLEFRKFVKVSDSFAEWLNMLVEPVIEDRFQSAQEALRVLQGRLLTKKASLPLAHRKPAGSKISFKRSANRLRVYIPPAGVNTSTVPIIFFTVLWNGFMLFWWPGILLGGAPFLFVLFSLPHTGVGLWLLGSTLFALAGKIHLEINAKKFRLRWRCLGVSRTLEGRTEDLVRMEVATTNMRFNKNKSPMMCCALWEGVRQHKFGTFLTPVEQEWLVAEVSDYLNNR